MRALPCLVPALLLAAPARAETDISALVATEGLRGAEATLAVLPEPTASERFALGAVRVLGGVERALQLRYAVGLSDGLAVVSDLPVLRLPLPENPAPASFEPAMIADLFEGLAADMTAAAATLETIGDDEAVAVPIDLADLWFDIDADGARTPGEGLLDVAGTLLGAGSGEAIPAVTIRFDTADSAWLAAYAHLLAGASEGILALDPEEAVGRVLAARAAFAARPPVDWSLDAQFGDVVDVVAMMVMAVEGQPDAARVRAMRDHWLAVVAQNRRVWTLVARETDNDAEWIPSKRQVSATGLPFPPDTGPAWLAVLDEAEGVLTGRLLLPWWRVGPGAGLDLAAMLEDPPALDVAGLVQGAVVAPFLREGKVADGAALSRFALLVQGDSLLYAIVLN